MTIFAKWTGRWTAFQHVLVALALGAAAGLGAAAAKAADTTVGIDSQVQAVKVLADPKAFDSGFGQLTKAAGQLAKLSGVVKFLLDLAKQDEPTADELILRKLTQIDNEFSGLDAKLDAKFAQLTKEEDRRSFRDRLSAVNADIETEYLRWRADEVGSSDGPATGHPGSYSDAKTFWNLAGKVRLLCTGDNFYPGGVFDAFAAADSGSYAGLPVLFASIMETLGMAQAMGSWQTYRQDWEKRLRAAKLPGDTIEEMEASAGDSTTMPDMRDAVYIAAAATGASQVEPMAQACLTSFVDAVKTYSAGPAVRDAARSVVLAQFLAADGRRFVDGKTSLILTFDWPQVYASGKGLGMAFYGSGDNAGTVDPTGEGGAFPAAVGKTLEALYPGYGFVAILFGQYNSRSTIPDSVLNRCDAAKPVSWSGDDVRIEGDALVWKDLPLDGPNRLCATDNDRYLFNLVVTGFQAARASTSESLNAVAAISAANLGMVAMVSSMQSVGVDQGKTARDIAIYERVRPFLWAAMPTMERGGRLSGAVYLYPSRYPDKVGFNGSWDTGFNYLVAPTPF